MKFPIYANLVINVHVIKVLYIIFPQILIWF